MARQGRGKKSIPSRKTELFIGEHSIKLETPGWVKTSIIPPNFSHNKIFARSAGASRRLDDAVADFVERQLRPRNHLVYVRRLLDADDEGVHDA
jgi:hypothetical protein